jgi:hypothetical protein
MRYYESEARALEVLRLMRLRAGAGETTDVSKLEVRFDRNRGKYFISASLSPHMVETRDRKSESSGRDD